MAFNMTTGGSGMIRIFILRIVWVYLSKQSRVYTNTNKYNIIYYIYL